MGDGLPMCEHACGPPCLILYFKFYRPSTVVGGGSHRLASVHGSLQVFDGAWALVTCQPQKVGIQLLLRWFIAMFVVSLVAAR